MTDNISMTSHQERTLVGLLMMLIVGLFCINKHVPCIALHIICLLTDILLIGLFLWKTPRLLSATLRISFEVVSYVAALYDTFCIYHFGEGITPTMIAFLFNTDSHEVVDFLNTYGGEFFTDWHTDVLLLLIIGHILLSWKIRKIRLPLFHFRKCKRYVLPVYCMLVSLGLVVSWPIRRQYLELLSQQNQTDTEALIFQGYYQSAYAPPLKWIFAHKSLLLVDDEIERLKESTFCTQIDSCSHRSKHIVVIIGESYNRHHSQLYGYSLPTTPHQKEWAEKGNLVVFTDVVSSWNITTNSFNQFFSLHHYGAERVWADYPLFPILFRHAEYRVAFLSNQFRRKRKSKSFNLAGGFFLNSSAFYRGLFDICNHKKSHNDLEFVTMNLPLISDCSAYKLDIIHLRGQHFEYENHYPKEQQFFKIADYRNRQLNDEEKQVVAHYDNATRWNDVVVDSILRNYKDSDAVVIYLADHGEEVYDDLPVKGRIYATPTARQARQEFEIPFWIWCSSKYIDHHPDIVAQIRSAARRPWITDRLPHLLLYLSGISHADYDERLSLIGPQNDVTIPRMIDGIIDYDSLMTSK